MTEELLNDSGPTVSERRNSSWDVANASRNYISLAVAQGGGALFAFASVWLITHTLGSQGYGSVIAVIAGSQVIQVVVNWTVTAVARFGLEEFVETGKIVRIFWTRLAVMAVCLLLVVATWALWFPYLADWLKLTPEIIWLLLAHFAVSALWFHVQFSLQAIKLASLQGWLLTTERILVFCGLIVLLMLGYLAPVAVVWCYTVAPFLMIIAGLVRLRHVIFGSMALSREYTGTLLKYSIPLLPFSLVGYFSTGYVDAIFVSKFISTGALGVYSVATQFIGIALQFPSLINTLLLPLFITLQKETRTEKTDRLFLHVIPSLTLFWGMCSLVVGFLGIYLIPAVFGPEFRDAGVPLWILFAASTTALPVLVGYGSFSTANSTTYISMFAVIFSAAANIGLNFLLIPGWGLKGCAWATLAAYLVSVSIHALLLRLTLKMPLSWTFAAMLPALVGVMYVSWREVPWEAFAAGFGSSVLLILWKRDSVKEAFRVITALIKRN